MPKRVMEDDNDGTVDSQRAIAARRRAKVSPRFRRNAGSPGVMLGPPVVLPSHSGASADVRGGENNNFSLGTAPLSFSNVSSATSSRGNAAVSGYAATSAAGFSFLSVPTSAIAPKPFGISNLPEAKPPIEAPSPSFQPSTVHHASSSGRMERAKPVGGFSFLSTRAATAAPGLYTGPKLPEVTPPLEAPSPSSQASALHNTSSSVGSAKPALGFSLLGTATATAVHNPFVISNLSEAKPPIEAPPPSFQPRAVHHTSSSEGSAKPAGGFSFSGTTTATTAQKPFAIAKLSEAKPPIEVPSPSFQPSAVHHTSSSEGSAKPASGFSFPGTTTATAAQKPFAIANLSEAKPLIEAQPPIAQPPISQPSGVHHVASSGRMESAKPVSGFSFHGTTAAPVPIAGPKLSEVTPPLEASLPSSQASAVHHAACSRKVESAKPASGISFAGTTAGSAAPDLGAAPNLPEVTHPLEATSLSSQVSAVDNTSSSEGSMKLSSGFSFLGTTAATTALESFPKPSFGAPSPSSRAGTVHLAPSPGPIENAKLPSEPTSAETCSRSDAPFGDGLTAAQGVRLNKVFESWVSFQTETSLLSPFDAGLRDYVAHAAEIRTRVAFSRASTVSIVGTAFKHSCPSTALSSLKSSPPKPPPALRISSSVIPKATPLPSAVAPKSTPVTDAPALSGFSFPTPSGAPSASIAAAASSGEPAPTPAVSATPKFSFSAPSTLPKASSGNQLPSVAAPAPASNSARMPGFSFPPPSALSGALPGRTFDFSVDSAAKPPETNSLSTISKFNGMVDSKFGGSFNGFKVPFGGIAAPPPPASADATGDDEEAGMPKDDPARLERAPGEENEVIVRVFRAKLYIFKKDANTWVDLGVGVLRLMKHNIDGSRRLVLRNDIGKVLLNVGLYKGMKVKKEKKSISISVNITENELTSVQLKVTADQIDDLHAAVVELVPTS